ncbi:MAG: formylglycine-generating enzyme family protein, partial [Candidatus Binatia bacterium]
MAAALLLALGIGVGAGAAGDLAEIPGGRFRSVLPIVPGVDEVTVAPFALARAPVTNAEFAAFVAGHPEWRRDRVPRLFADGEYLSHWPSPAGPGPGAVHRPVTRVSWFAAAAYCEARGLRLPTWYEWELAAAAGETTADARQDPAWRQRILDWYARPGTEAPAVVGASAANVYGVHDLHGVVWEWVEDFAGLMVAGDNREQGDPDRTRYCGAGALTLEQKENYAVLMRIAMLSSLEGAWTTANLGFRCARSSPG